MKRRVKAEGDPVKSRRRKTAAPKRRNATKSKPVRSSPAGGRETEAARLARELHEVLERQTATSEVLQIISSSAGNLEPVFAAILENAVRFCDASFGDIYRWQEGVLR